MAGLAGVAALARLLSARRARVEARERAAHEADPADVLREKLAESRAEPAGAVAPHVPGHEPAALDETFDERRARIHAKAQEAIDSMQEPPA
jgi:hypothetical protein